LTLAHAHAYITHGTGKGAASSRWIEKTSLAIAQHAMQPIVSLRYWSISTIKFSFQSISRRPSFPRGIVLYTTTVLLSLLYSNGCSPVSYGNHTEQTILDLGVLLSRLIDPCPCSQKLQLLGFGDVGWCIHSVLHALFFFSSACPALPFFTNDVGRGCMHLWHVRLTACSGAERGCVAARRGIILSLFSRVIVALAMISSPYW
jgi:hypothetical protein